MSETGDNNDEQRRRNEIAKGKAVVEHDNYDHNSDDEKQRTSSTDSDLDIYGNCDDDKDEDNSKPILEFGGNSSNKRIFWTDLEHRGVKFPPLYEPHGIMILYDKKPVTLTPEQEEMATLYASISHSKYVEEGSFKKNFMRDWKKILGKDHIIQELKHCDFSPIRKWYTEGGKKEMSKSEREEEEKIYGWASVDGETRRIKNYKIEPPGLFIGRGKNINLGRVKRLRPCDVTINIGGNATIPPCNVPGNWGQVVSDNTVHWIARWKDTIRSGNYKYMTFATMPQTDLEKFDTARRLKAGIEGIRAKYLADLADLRNVPAEKMQIAVATYFIDRLAFRAGSEKVQGVEATTVGCCTLKVKHVEPIPPKSLKFQFVGKDSVEYKNEVEVDSLVYTAVVTLREGKSPGEYLFDELDSDKLNASLKQSMDGLTQQKSSVHVLLLPLSKKG